MKLPEGSPRPTPDEQLAAWVRGEPICPSTSGECCPDFSCCVPKLLVPQPVREAFARAPQADREAMMMGFLGAAITEHTDAKVHVTRANRGRSC